MTDVQRLSEDARNSLWTVLEGMSDKDFTNGRTAAFYDILATLEKHITTVNRSVKLHIDKWDVAGKIYTLTSYVPNSNISTGVKIGIIDDEGSEVWMVVPYHSIEWIS